MRMAQEGLGLTTRKARADPALQARDESLRARGAATVLQLRFHAIRAAEARGPSRRPPAVAIHQRSGRGRQNVVGREGARRPSECGGQLDRAVDSAPADLAGDARARHRDRKSTRLNSSHVKISYAVFCLKKRSKY